MFSVLSVEIREFEKPVHHSVIVFLQKGMLPDLLATSGDYLRIWRIGESEAKLESLLNNVRVQ